MEQSPEYAQAGPSSQLEPYHLGPTPALDGDSTHPYHAPPLTDGGSSSVRHSLPPYSDEAIGGSSASTSAIIPETPVESFFDIAPRSDATAFQVGYLGLKGFQAWIKGDVLVKLDEQSRGRGGYSKCTVELKAVESVRRSAASREDGTPEKEEVELFYSSKTLWDASAATTSTSPPPVLPSTMPFSFSLTPDLPHCIHSRDSSLTYHIEARLESANPSLLPDAVKIIPVHLTRYTRPGPLDERALAEVDGTELPPSEFSFEPHTWTIHSPTTVYIQINKTIFRRAEPIDVKVRVPPPTEESVTEKGLKLRSVEADLVRIISIKQPVSSAYGKEASSESQEADDKSSNRVSIAASDAITSQYEDAVLDLEPTWHEALLAHSGKLCRFHSQRPVLLRLTLHPPFDPANMPHPHPDHDALATGPVFGRGGGGGCESISQETVLHTVSFEVRIKIGIMGGRGERRDILCKKAVRILPGAAGLTEDSQFTVREAEKARAPDEPGHLDFGMDDEYDGYEDVGANISELIEEANGVEEPESSTSHEERLEQLRQLLAGPPPTLQESQNDLQVEVEVEGVGLAMPRHRPNDELPPPLSPPTPDPPVVPREPPPYIDADVQPRRPPAYGARLGGPPGYED